jgi:hypothetical protein
MRLTEIRNSFYQLPNSAPNPFASMRIPHAAKKRVLLAELGALAFSQGTENSRGPFQTDQDGLSQEESGLFEYPSGPSSLPLEGVLQQQYNFHNNSSGRYRGCPHCQSQALSPSRDNIHQGLVNQPWTVSNPPPRQGEVCPSCSLTHRAPQGTPSNDERMLAAAGIIFSETPVPSPLAAIFQDAIFEIDAHGQTDGAGSYETFDSNVLDRPHDINEVADHDPPPPYSLQA